MQEITDVVQHDSFIAKNPRGIMFYGSVRCPHCRNMKPVVDRMIQQYPSVAFSHVETTQVEVIHVDGVPVFVGYKNGSPVDVVIGASPEDLKDLIEKKLLK